jgi:hypothetical protein
MVRRFESGIDFFARSARNYTQKSCGQNAVPGEAAAAAGGGAVTPAGLFAV